MFSFGIMQGRLTEPKGRGIQFFPFDNWENEFVIASEIGLQEIEFIFDWNSFENNPLWTEEGIIRINRLIEQYNVKVNSICFDYFMRRPFFKDADEKSRELLRKENRDILLRLVDSAERIGAQLIEIPLVDNSSIKNDFEKSLFADFLREILHASGSIVFGLETDFPPQSFKEFMDSLAHSMVRANYDSGNSSGLGYDHYEEITTLGGHIANVHIKDRVFGGTTVKLGTGSADFDKVFSALKQIGYYGSFILQAARGEDGKEQENISAQIAFVKEYVQKFGLL